MTNQNLEKKICSKCGIEKSISCFYFRKDTGKHRTECKECHLFVKKQYHIDNKDKLNAKSRKWNEDHKKERREYNKQYWEENKKELAIQNKQSRQDNIEIYRARDRKYRKSDSGRKKKNEWAKTNRNSVNTTARKCDRNRRKKDPTFKLRKNISRLLNFALKANGSSKMGKSTFQHLPYSSDELKSHIEKLFASWMTWNNYGSYNSNTHDTNPTWTLDHIIPQSDLPFDNFEHPNFLKCWALSNLRPLDAKQNCIDGVNKTRHKKKDQL